MKEQPLQNALSASKKKSNGEKEKMKGLKYMLLKTYGPFYHLHGVANWNYGVQDEITHKQITQLYHH